MVYDFCIIGAGIVGCSIAFELSKYNLNVIVLEKQNDVSMGTTKANSGIIHAGYDPEVNTKMARLNVEGNKLVEELHPLLNFHMKNIGSLVIGHDEKEHKLIDELYQRGIANGVTNMQLLKSKEEVHKIDERLNDDVDYALLANTAKIVSPWELAIALACTAKINGVNFEFSVNINDIIENKNSYTIKSNLKDIECKYIINCAGLHADDVYNMALKERQADDKFTITPCRGEYYLLDKEEGNTVKHVVFQTPTDKGKGVLVSPTVHGNLIVGPDASYDSPYKDYTGNRIESLNYVKSESKKTVANINFGNNIRNFAGVRATIKNHPDFLIEESKVLPNFINFAGIKSPGLSCGPAFGKELVRMLNKKVKFTPKKDFKYYRLPDYFSEVSNEDKIKLIKKDNRYGQVICRCETVTEGEIVAAIHMPIEGRSIDAVKRRTNSGMGRCQGGFCGPKIFDILKRELKLSGTEINQDKDGSKVVLSKTKGE